MVVQQLEHLALRLQVLLEIMKQQQEHLEVAALRQEHLEVALIQQEVTIPRQEATASQQAAQVQGFTVRPQEVELEEQELPIQ